MKVFTDFFQKKLMLAGLEGFMKVKISRKNSVFYEKDNFRQNGMVLRGDVSKSVALYPF